jgi:hypothetical protein
MNNPTAKDAERKAHDMVSEEVTASAIPARLTLVRA